MDDEQKNKRIEQSTKAKKLKGRKRKVEEKAQKVIPPEVFVSNYRKKQRNFVKYKRAKDKITKGQVAPADLVKPDSLVLAVRLRESSNTNP